MSFWETNVDKRELGVFVYDANRWNDRQYGIWQPTPDLSVYFRYTNKKLFFNYPLISGTRSTALSFFPEQEGAKHIAEFNGRLNSIVEKYGSKAAKNMIIPSEVFYRYPQLLMMRYAMLGLNKIKDWQLTYPENEKRPENIFNGNVETTPDKFVEQLSTSPMVYYPVGLNFYPGIHSITHRILYSKYVEGYLKNYLSLSTGQRKSVEALLMISGYVNTLEEMNSIRHSLSGTPNMASDGWSVSPQIAFLFPKHSMAKEWCDVFEKQLQINGLFYTRPDVKQYESLGGRWVESLAVYNWANLRPTSFSRTSAELFDGKNRFAYPELINRARWMRDMMTTPITGKGRCYPPHGAHGGGYLVPRFNLYDEVAQSLKYLDPILSENMFWSCDSINHELEVRKGETDWHAVYKTLHPEKNNGTNPHLKSCKYTGHGIVLRSGVDSPDGENGRGITAVKLLAQIEKIDIDELIQLGYNKHLSAFDILLPSFLAEMKKDTLSPSLSKAVTYLNNWNRDADAQSIATTIAIEWATKWSLEIPAATTEEEGTQIIKKYERMVKEVSTQKKKELLNATLEQLKKIYGTWEMPWGEINRYQRADPGNMMDDQAPSWAVSQASSKWGSLPSFDSKRFDGTIKRYGYNGNSFVAAVSFGKKLVAKTIITGGQSKFSKSAHFTDQAQGYIDGQFKTVHFYKADVLANKVTSYKPGFIK
jgi:hypothetical protein